MAEGGDHSAQLIREVFSYAHRFRGQTFVVQTDSRLSDTSSMSLIVDDLVILHRAGIRLLLVPGARRHIDALLERFGIDSRLHAGVRIAETGHMPVIAMAALDAAHSVMTRLAVHGVHAVVGNWVRARAIGVVDGIDYGDSAVVESFALAQVQSIIDRGGIPVFPCLGWSGTGRPYNVTSTQLASRLAVSLGAKKLFFVGHGLRLDAERYDADGLELSAGTISRMDLAETEKFLAGNSNEAELLEHDVVQPLGVVRLAASSCREGVERVHILDGRESGVILREVFSNRGSGTMVYANEYESIRPMRGADAGEVFRLMKPLIDQKVLKPRTEADLYERAEDYVVYETDGTIHGCAALHQLDESSAELGGLAVSREYAAQRVGRKLVEYLMARAADRGISRVFALTTRTADWFLSVGFREASLAEVPEQKRDGYDPERNSRIYLRET